MEIVDLENLLLKDTGIYSSYSGFYPILRQRGITKVSQLFNEDIVSSVKKKLSLKRQREFDAFLGLINYKYLDIPMPLLSSLNKPLIENGSLNMDAEELGFFRPANKIFYEAASFLLKNKKLNNSASIIEFFKAYLANLEKLYDIKTDKKFISIMVLYVDAYEKNNCHSIDNDKCSSTLTKEEVEQKIKEEYISIFKERLEEKQKAKEALEIEINYLNYIIEYLNELSENNDKKL